jgi:hypothetical protein
MLKRTSTIVAAALVVMLGLVGCKTVNDILSKYDVSGIASAAMRVVTIGDRVLENVANTEGMTEEVVAAIKKVQTGMRAVQKQLKTFAEIFGFEIEVPLKADMSEDDLLKELDSAVETLDGKLKVAKE